MEADVLDHLLLDIVRVLSGDMVSIRQKSELSVSIEALSNSRIEFISKISDHLWNCLQIAKRSSSSFVKKLSSEDNNLMGGLVIDTGYNGCRVWEFVLLEEAVERLLDDLLVGEFG